jgi:hypothetical protein
MPEHEIMTTFPPSIYMEHADHPRTSWFAVLANLGCYIPLGKCSKKKRIHVWQCRVRTRVRQSTDNHRYSRTSVVLALRPVSIREARAKVFFYILMHIGRMDRTQGQPALTGVDMSSKLCGGYTIAGLRILPEVADHMLKR